LKVITGSGWFAARPSSDKDIDKIYAESFREKDHPACVLAEAQANFGAVPAALAQRLEIEFRINLGKRL
jgi:phosphoglucomutase